MDHFRLEWPVREQQGPPGSRLGEARTELQGLTPGAPPLGPGVRRPNLDSVFGSGLRTREAVFIFQVAGHVDLWTEEKSLKPGCPVFRKEGPREILFKGNALESLLLTLDPFLTVPGLRTI